MRENSRAPEVESTAQPPADDGEATTTAAGIAIVSSASYVALITSVVRALTLARILGPMGRGVLSGVRLLASYFGNSHLGLLHGMNKLMPLALGRGERARAEALQNTAFASTTALAAIAGLGICVCALLDLRHLDPETRLALALGGAAVIANHATAFYTGVLRSFGRFRIIGQALLVMTLAEFGLPIGLALLLGARGAIAGFVLAQLGVLVYLIARARLRLALRLRWAEVAVLLRAGVPLLAMLLVDQLYRTVDCALIVKYERVTALGLYGIGSQLAAMLCTIPNSVAYVLFPQYLKTYGKAGVEGLRGQFFIATVGLASLMPVLAGVGYLLCPYAIRLLLPDFVEGVGAIQVLLLGSSLLAVPVAADQALITFNREKHLIAFRFAGVLVIGAATFALVHTPLVGAELLRRIALGACAGYVLTSGLSLASAFSVYTDRRAIVVGETLLSYLPLVYCLGALRAARSIARALAGDVDVPGGLCIALAAFLLACAPLLIYLQRRTGMVSRVARSLLRSGRRRNAGDS